MYELKKNDLKIFRIVLDEHSLFSDIMEKDILVADYESFLEACLLINDIKSKVYSEYNDKKFFQFEEVLKNHQLPIKIVLNSNKYTRYFEKTLVNPDIVLITPLDVFRQVFDGFNLPTWFNDDFILQLDLINHIEKLQKISTDHRDLRFEDLLFMHILEIPNSDELKTYRNTNSPIILFLKATLNTINKTNREIFEIFSAQYRDNLQEMEVLKQLIDYASTSKTENINRKLLEIFILDLNRGYDFEIVTEKLEDCSDELMTYYNRIKSLLGDRIYEIINVEHDLFSRLSSELNSQMAIKHKSDLETIIDQMINSQEDINTKLERILQKFPSYMFEAFHLEFFFNFLVSCLYSGLISNKSTSIKESIFIKIDLLIDKNLDFMQKYLPDSSLVSVMQNISFIFDALFNYSNLVIKMKFEHISSITDWMEFYKNIFSEFSSFGDLVLTQNDLFEIYGTKSLNKLHKEFEETFLKLYKKVQISFEVFLIRKYPAICNGELKVKRIIDVMDTIETKLNENRNRRIFLIVLDGMSYDSWKQLKPLLQNYPFGINEELIVSTIPTVTEIARKCLFGGYYYDKLSVMHRNPSDEKTNFLKKFHHLPISLKYATSISDLRDSLSHKYKITSYIIDDLDIYAHVKTDLPKNIRDEMISDVRAKLDHILGIISNSNLSEDDMIILTTDHGMQRVYNTTSFPRLDKNKFEKHFQSGRVQLLCEGSRFRMQEMSVYNPIDKIKDNFHIINYYEFKDYCLPASFYRMGNPIALVIAKTNNKFPWQRSPYTHGGLSMEEIFIPYIELTLSGEIVKPLIHFSCEKEVEINQDCSMKITLANITNKVIKVNKISFNDLYKNINEHIDLGKEKSFFLNLKTNKLGVLKGKSRINYMISNTEFKEEQDIIINVIRPRTHVKRKTDDMMERLMKDE